jgi:hypothetical protein
VTGLDVVVDTRNDGTNECDETFNLGLTNPSGCDTAGAAIAGASASATILDDDTVQISVTAPAPGTVTEDNAFTFRVTLDQASPQTVSVDYRTSDGTADSTTDYTTSSGTLNFSTGVTGLDVVVDTRNDGTNECDETFNLGLTNPSGCDTAGAAIAGASASATIEDDDTVQITVAAPAPGTVTEDNAFTFRVTLDQASPQTVSVDYRTNDGTADSTTDYTTSSGTLNFSTGVTGLDVVVDTRNDGTNECDETFNLGLTNPSGCDTAGAAIAGASASATILDDDTVQISVTAPAPGTVTEDNAFTFRVTLDQASPQTVSVDYRTSDGTADSTTDYTTSSGTLNFSTGVTGLDVVVDTRNDGTNECDETFSLDLTNPSGCDNAGAAIAGASATATIEDDDAVQISVTAPAPSTVSEGDAYTFRVTLDQASPAAIDVDFFTSDGTANAVTDYAASTGTLTFNAGITGVDVIVTTTEDSANEADETFDLNLTNSSGCGLIPVIAGPTATVTILDDDNLDFSITDVFEDETDGVTTFDFRVSLTASSTQNIAVNYSTSDGPATSASAGDDYTATNGTLAFSPGTTGMTIQVTVIGDTTCESDENFTVTLTMPSGNNVNIADDTGLGKVQDDDTQISLDDIGGRENNYVYTAVQLDTCVDLQSLFFQVSYDGDTLAFVDDSEETIGARILDDGRLGSHGDDEAGMLFVWIEGFGGTTNITNGQSNIVSLCFRINPGADLVATALTLSNVDAIGLDGNALELNLSHGSITPDSELFLGDVEESGDTIAPLAGASQTRAVNTNDALWIYRALKFGPHIDWIPIIPTATRNTLHAAVTSDREILAFVRGLGNELDVDGVDGVEAEKDAVYIYRNFDGGFGTTVPATHEADNGTVNDNINGTGDLDTREADVIVPVEDAATTNAEIPADNSTTAMVITFDSSLRLDDTVAAPSTGALLTTANLPASGLIASSRGAIGAGIAVTVSADGRTITVTPLGSNWAGEDTVTVDRDAIEDVAGVVGVGSTIFTIP